MTLESIESAPFYSVLPTPNELHKEIPLSDAHASFVQHSRETIEAILNGWDPRHILIVGPCSIHDLNSAREYAARLRALSEYVSDQFFLIMRTYFEKPRTIIGWKGLLYDPDLDGSHDFAKGVRQTRQLLAELTEMGIPTGSELLEINTSHYYSDFLSWGCIGARTCASPPHRQLAASLPLPIGFKNSTNGNIDYPIHGILSASTPHVYLGMSPAGRMSRIETEGNPLCHVVLRGGLHNSNYDEKSIQYAAQKCRQAKIRDKLLVDCSHDNCRKEPLFQKTVFEHLIQQISERKPHIAGIMLESHLNEGSQPISSSLDYGVSITDPCLDWETTEHIILNAHAHLHKQSLCLI